MSKQFEHFLLGLLWLLAATLGTTFWLNINFGFNIFSASHWEYLSYLQAAGTPVHPMFYISLLAAMIITVAGLYLMICGPFGGKWRRQRTTPASAPSSDASTLDTLPNMPPAAPASSGTPVTPPAAPRPPRLNIARPSTTPPMPAPRAPSDQDFEEIRKIFTDAGYTVKNPPQIGNYRPALTAIGTGENIWIGGINAAPDQIQNTMDKLSEVFSDTLEDIDITIHGFVIAPTQPVTDDAILSFDDINALREYMSAHTNPPLSDDEKENFEAYSEYIDTVIKFIGTM